MPLPTGVTVMRICPECEKKTTERTCVECRTATVPLSSVSNTDPLIGSQIGNYEIQGVIGRGGMGVVYRGLQLSMDRPVAIKVISPSLAKDLQVVKRFQREAKLTSKLQHPNSIRVYDFGLTEEGVPYLVMELLEGRELVQEMRAVRQMSLERSVSVITQVLKALNEAHGLGIVHRDLKPANIFLTRMGEEDLVKVMDFGIAKVVRGEGESSNQNLTQTGLLVGTPQYMSPEQIKGGTIDHRSDIYSLGCIFYQMLCGHVPFTADNPVAVMMMHTSEAPQPIANFRPDLAGNAALQDVMDRFLAKKAENRPVSAMHAISLLQRVAPASVETAGGDVMALDTAGFRKLEEQRAQSVPNPMTPLPDGGIPPQSVAPTAELPSDPRVARPPTGKSQVITKSAIVAASVDDPGTDPELKRPAELEAALSEATVASDGDDDDDQARGAPKSKLPLIVMVAGTLGAAAAGITFFAVNRPAAPPSTPVVQQPAAAPAPAPAKAPPKDPEPVPAAPEKITISLRSSPEGAAVLVDGAKVGVTPYEHEVLKDGKALDVKMTMDGYEAVTTTAVPDRDRTVELTLKKVPEKAPEKAKAPEKQKAPEKARPSTTKPAPKKKKSNDADLLEDL